MTKDHRQAMAAIRKHREKNFRLRFLKRSRYRCWNDESLISITYNGAQSTSISLLPDEAKQLHALLGKKFNLA